MKRTKARECLRWAVLLLSISLFAQGLAGQVPEATSPAAEPTQTHAREVFTVVSVVENKNPQFSAGLLPDAPSARAEKSREDAPPSTPVQGSVGKPGPIFWSANGLMMASTVVNVEMIMRCRPESCQSVPDAIRSRGALYGIGIPATLGATYISYRMRRSGNKWWILPVAVVTAGNIVYAAHAAQNAK